jgi:dihydroorotate dehydrogenase
MFAIADEFDGDAEVMGDIIHAVQYSRRVPVMAKIAEAVNENGHARHVPRRLGRHPTRG